MSQTANAADTTGITHPRTHCAVDPDGRITFVLPPGTAADVPAPQLLLRLRPKKGQPENTLRVLDLRPGDDGRLNGVLEAEPALAEGRWDLYLLTDGAGPGAPRHRLRPGLRDLRALVDGHTRERPSPVAVRVPYATKDGFLALRTWLRTAHAEITRMTATDRSLTVHVWLHGAPLTESATVRLRPRGGAGAARVLPARPDGDGDGGGQGFSFTVDYAELVTDGGGAPRVWDAFVKAESAGAPVRISRLLDDVADRKGIFVYPTATVGGATVRPYYTVDNDLAVQVTPTAV
ncbi:transferase [Streptomyces sp. NPDC006997]|uniref:transferase n=1 Tax=Streptomyces sp. NPDC006997 TaxID=3155356 RepID=UPI0033E2E1A7